jgi:hypothetical protein
MARTCLICVKIIKLGRGGLNFVNDKGYLTTNENNNRRGNSKIESKELRETKVPIGRANYNIDRNTRIGDSSLYARNDEDRKATTNKHARDNYYVSNNYPSLRSHSLPSRAEIPDQVRYDEALTCLYAINGSTLAGAAGIKDQVRHDEGKTCEFEKNTYEFNKKAYEFNKFTYEFITKAYEFNTPTYEFNNKTYEFNTFTYEFKGKTYDFGKKTYEFITKAYEFNASAYEFNTNSEVFLTNICKSATNSYAKLTNVCKNATFIQNIRINSKINAYLYKHANFYSLYIQ